MEADVYSAKSDWYLVTSLSGETAVVPAEDLRELLSCNMVFSAFRISCNAGRAFEENRARGSFMSANHRIKAGESGGVG
jgi:hypothetical protein